MATKNLGRLTPVDLRNVWTNEAGDFTPWLAERENIELLGETIGIDLEVEAQEKGVGPFRADILCKDTATDDWVLIENQLERTDHVHLGQLLTYAAGLKAVTIVWVARRFTEEHRAALDWLNEITDDRFHFFGLEVEAWRIGDSPAAPKFNVVSKPNEWSRQVAENAARAAEGNLSESRQLQLEFWTGFREQVELNGERIRATKPLPHHWMNLAIGRSGFHLSAVVSQFGEGDGYDEGELRAEFVITHDRSAACFEWLKEQLVAIEAEFGEPLTWYSAEGVKMKRIFVRRPASLGDRAAWPEFWHWLIEKLDRLHAVFQNRIKGLDINALPNDGDGSPL